MITTTDLIFKLIPGVTLMAIYRQQDQKVRLIAQSKTASFLVVHGITNELVLFDSEQFISWMRFLEVDSIQMLLPKKNAF